MGHGSAPCVTWSRTNICRISSLLDYNELLAAFRFFALFGDGNVASRCSLGHGRRQIGVGNDCERRRHSIERYAAGSLEPLAQNSNRHANRAGSWNQVEKWKHALVQAEKHALIVEAALARDSVYQAICVLYER